MQQAVGRHADRERQQPGQQSRHRPPGLAQTLPFDRPRGPVGDAGVAAVTPQPQLRGEQERAAEHEHAGDHVGRRPVERGAVLVVDRGGEGGEAEHLERPELRQQVQPHEQGTAQHRRSQLGKHYPPERAPPAVLEGVRGLLERRVEAAQGGDDGQVDQRVVGQGHDQDRAGVALDRVGERHPAEAVDERWYRQRCHEQPVPQRPPGEVGPLHDPGGADPDHEARGHAADDQARRVPQQHADARPHEQVPGLGRADDHGVGDDEPERHQREQGHGHPRGHQQGRRPPGRGGGLLRSALRGVQVPLQDGSVGGQSSPSSCISSVTDSLLRLATSMRGGSSSENGFTDGSRETSGLRGYSRA